MSTVQLIHDDAWDWEIAVVDGRAVAGNHSLSAHDWLKVCEALGATAEEVEVEDITESEHYHQ